MNKLREKFEIADTRSMIKSTFIDKCEQITDDFSVKFAEWLNENRWYTFENGKWCYSFEQGTAISKSNYDKNYRKTTTELLQIFKTQYYE